LGEKMSSRLEQAMQRLDAAVSALESQPAQAPAAASSETAGHALEDGLKKEIADIRHLVDQALTMVETQSQSHSEGGK
jgi:exonuclease VII small subunit